MPIAEYLIAGLLVVASVGVATVFGYRQARQLRANANPSTDDQKFAYRTARRRLLIGLLLGVAGVLMAATYLAGWATSVDAIGEQRAGKAVEDHRPLDSNERAVMRAFGYSWIGVLVLLLAIVCLVGWDLHDVRRHWRHSLNRLRDDRRAMLNRQIANIRAQRGYRDEGG